ncbi:transposase family protein [Streptomyces lavendulae]|uniref:transposase family protein n=1 Tax=Streptomyces lavendulae TaxID=1914 RepID=UPI0033F18EBD
MRHRVRPLEHGRAEGGGRVFGSGVLGRLLPHLSDVVIESIKRTTGVITLRTGCRTSPVRCPGCGMPSWRVHGRYVRRLGDAPMAGSPVVIELTVRRFKCLSSRCPAVTFAEQNEGLTSGICGGTLRMRWRERWARTTGASRPRSRRPRSWRRRPRGTWSRRSRPGRWPCRLSRRTARSTSAAKADAENPTRRPLDHDAPPAPRDRRRRGTEGDPRRLPSPLRHRTAHPRSTRLVRGRRDAPQPMGLRRSRSAGRRARAGTAGRSGWAP